MWPLQCLEEMTDNYYSFIVWFSSELNFTRLSTESTIPWIGGALRKIKHPSSSLKQTSRKLINQKDSQPPPSLEDCQTGYPTRSICRSEGQAIGKVS